jgi:hypothetical protein
VRIKNTLELDHMLVSERLTRDIDASRPVTIDPHPQILDFDAEGNLLPLSVLKGPKDQ